MTSRNRTYPVISLLFLTLFISSLNAAKIPVIRIIAVKTQSEAEGILSEIDKGRSFASVAKERSIDIVTRDRFGEVAAAAFEGLDKPIKEAALALGEGEVSGVIALSDNRYALVLRVDMTDYRKGTKAFKEGDFKSAEKSLLRHVELNPDAVKARLTLGRIYEGAGETRNAEVNYREALRFDPSCEEAYLRLGSLYLGRGEAQRAKETYDEGLHQLPDSKPLRTGMEKTKKRLLSARTSPPKNDAAENKPLEREIPRTEEEKKEDLKTSAPPEKTTTGETPEGMPSIIGASKKAQGKKMHIRIIFSDKESDALDILSEVKKGRPFALLAKERSVDEKTRETYGYLGEVDVGSLHASLQEALSTLKEGQTSSVIKMDKNRFAIVQVTDMDLYSEGERAFIAGDYPAAEGKLSRYVEANPDAVRARTMLGKIYEDRKEPSKAIEMYKDAISYSPKTVLVYERLARVYLFLGMYQKAKEIYVQGLLQVPSSPVFEEGIEMADMLLIGSGEKMP